MIISPPKGKLHRRQEVESRPKKNDVILSYSIKLGNRNAATYRETSNEKNDSYSDSDTKRNGKRTLLSE